MKLSLADLPHAVRQAYEAWAENAPETLRLDCAGAAVETDAIAVSSGTDGLMYITRDGGQTFETTPVETIHLDGEQAPDECITVRRIVRVRHAPS
jgi:hypothetical protein